MVNRFHGVIEGFYRKPYTFRQRHDLITFLADIGLNTYVYAPKNDHYHRRRWSVNYPKKYLKKFEELNKHCVRHNVHFNFALSPMQDPDGEKIINKLKPLVKLGINHFSLLYDDISVPLSQATADCQIKATHVFFRYLQGKLRTPVLFFCPTQYRGLKDTRYLMTLRRHLNRKIHIFWTGRRVVSFRITKEDIEKIAHLLGRPPLIWDNIFANDYIPGIVLRMPYRYRAPGIVQNTTGILVNPMNQYNYSKPLIFTVAEFIKNPYGYKPRKAWREAMQILNT